ncbi:MAG: leucine-rich repeat protein [Candidatus Coproplasma sp.]
MKKRILLTIVAVLSFCSFAFGLTACAKKEHEHTYVDTVVAPTCTELGYTVHTCSECQFSYVDTYVVALGHSYTNYVSNGDATCTQDGTKTATCDRDGCNERVIVTDEGSAFGHSYGAPEWSWTGHESATATFTCATDSKHVENVTATITSVVNTPATCDTDGLITYTATVSLGGKTYVNEKSETLEKLGHNYIVTWTWTGYESAKATFTCANDNTHAENLTATITSAVTTPVTCDTDGVKTYTAMVSFGGKTYTDEKIETLEKLGHSFTNYVSNGDATYDADGTKTATCDNGCGATDTITDPGTMLGHSYGAPEWTWTGYESAKATFTCQTCTQTEHKQTVEATISSEITTPATCAAEGVKTYTATLSFKGEIYTNEKSETLAKLNHSFTHYVSNGDATCTEDGTKTATCDNGCGATDTITDEGTKLGHDYGAPVWTWTDYTSATATFTCGNDGNHVENITATGADVTSVVTTPATCTADGLKTYTATVSFNGETYTDTKTETLAKLGHSFTNYVSNNDATCTEDGTKTATCDRDGCNERVTVTDEGTKLGHSYTNYVSNGDATCTEDGTKTATCDRDGCSVTDTVTDEGTKLGHSFTEYVYNNDATCTEDGTATATCDHEGCGETHTKTIEGNKLGHRLINHKAQAPTCTEIGWETYDDCSRCDYTTYVELPATGHTQATAVEENRVEATCEQDGHYDSVVYCSVCQAELNRENKTIDKLGHSFTNYISNDDATCSEDGTKTATCDRCDATDTVTYEGSKLGHSYGAPVWTWTGYTSAKATFTCSHDSAHVEEVTATGEKITNEITTNPTCTATGVRTYTATVTFGGVNYTGTATEDVAATGHTWSDNACRHCGYDAGGSKGLNMVLNAETNTYSLNGKGTCKDAEIVIPATYNGKPVTAIGANAFQNRDGFTSITIPASVTSIGNKAFYGCKDLQSINVDENNQSYKSIGGNLYTKDETTLIQYAKGKTQTSFEIPASVESIAEYAFINCDGLTSITIPASVTSIGNYAFEYCSGLESVMFGENSQLTSIGYYVFGNCFNLTSITIPASVKSIGDYAFYDCHDLTSITIPASVTSIGTKAFYECTALTEINYNATQCADLSSNNYVFYEAGQNGTGITVTIGANVTKIPACLFCPSIDSSYAPKITSVVFAEGSVCESIGDYAFYNCSGLTSITIPASVTSIGANAFYNCSGLTSITIPASVTSIGANAFYNCSGLTSVTFGENSNLKSIGKNAFDVCIGLTSIIIPDSVESIGDSAFYNCIKLTRVYYGGTVVKWNNITIGATNNDKLKGENIYYYSKTEPTAEGNYWHYGANGEIVIWQVNLSAGLSYTLNADSAGYTVSGIGTCTDTEIVIPSACYDGLPVTAIGANAFQNHDGFTSITIPASVTSIGDEAFRVCSSLTSVTFGANSQLTSIGANAFQNCSSLESITIPASVTSIGNYAFRGTSLTSITIPASVTSIGNYAFYDCDELKSIAIPTSVTSIGNNAFNGCTALTEINYNATECADLSNNGVFYEAGQSGDGITVTIGANVTKIPAYLFCPSIDSSYAPKITSVVFAEGSVCESIGDYAFYNCSGFTSITIPASITSIGTYAFYNCSGLTSVYYSGTAEAWGSIEICSKNNALTSATIYYYSETEPTEKGNFWYYVDGNIVFWDSHFSIGLEYTLNADGLGYTVSKGDCTDTEIVIPSACYDGKPVTAIGADAFKGNTAITSITIPASVTSIGNNAFMNCIGLTEINYNAMACADLEYNNGVFYKAGQNGTGITVTIGANVTKIPAYLFFQNLSNDAPKITSVVFAEGSVCKSIGGQAFYYCSSLTSVTFGANSQLTSIGAGAFQNCSSLESITIPASVTSIGGQAFYYCSSLTSVTFGANSQLTSIGTGAFQNCSGLTSITIPASVTNIYGYAFNGCSSLTSVYYNGTAEAWGSITKGSNNTALTSATIYYYSANEPALNEEGNFWHYVDGEIVVWVKES